LRAGLPATVVAAAAAVAAVAAIQAPSPVPAPRPGGREILLTAARTVARAAQPVTGRYWVTPGTVGNFLKVGPADGPYLMLEGIAALRASQPERLPSASRANGPADAGHADGTGRAVPDARRRARDTEPGHSHRRVRETRGRGRLHRKVHELWQRDPPEWR